MSEETRHVYLVSLKYGMVDINRFAVKKETPKNFIVDPKSAEVIYGGYIYINLSARVVKGTSIVLATLEEAVAYVTNALHVRVNNTEAQAARARDNLAKFQVDAKKILSEGKSGAHEPQGA